MMTKKKNNRLRQLIREKYGEEKFGLGLNIVAQWVNATTGTDWNAKTVFDLCDSTGKRLMMLSKLEAEALRQLFGLKSTDQLLNNSSMTPL